MSDLVLSHLWLPPVRCRALGVRRSSPAWDDCVQEGNLALIKAEERYDEAKGTFESYARPWVDNAVKAFFCAQQVVSEPVKQVSARAARGEPAHARSLQAVDQPSHDYNGSTVGSRPGEAVLGTDDSEETWHDALERLGGLRWLGERLSELPRHHADALWNLASRDGTFGASAAEYARKIGVSRETVRVWAHEAMASLQESAGCT